ncbi:hypothetical protein SAMN05216251_118117 [Actinacidiphila alni]|uniref:Lipoprotein n=1 Tax=Actinacidiphila alni TaxID=380248 RepID=A0A1I2JQF6_9ACTN|nr:hypothetical protein [Actinacidiphila alni]SFF54996.1 hypothetical protein SAMN05216251_118117 [Actinacidiphila alni]
MRARGARVVGAGLLVVAAAGCGGGGHPLVVSGQAPTTPYAGPLLVAAHRGDDVAARAGAAARALECDGPPYSGGGPDRWSAGDGGSTPAKGLAAWFAMDQPDVPRDGYRVERAEADRVLFSYDVGGRTKVAVVVAKDQPGRPGWGPETTASCDPSEFPASYTDRQPYEIWADAAGRRQPLSRVNSSVGPAHCGWQAARFLEVGATLYARDPSHVLPPGMLSRSYAARVALPPDARDTGFHRGDQHLWLAADDSFAYIGTAGAVEAWPSVTPGHACA